MKKQFILIMVLIALLSAFSFSASAQDEEELPACDTMELMTNLESLMQPLTDLGEMSAPEEATGAAYAALVADFDAYATEYWASFAETEFSCAEEYQIASTMGSILDEALIVSELSALAVYEAEVGNDEAATTYSEQVGERASNLSDQIMGMTDIMTNMMGGTAEEPEELDACSEDDMAAVTEGLTTINETYADLGAALSEGAEGDLSEITLGFATLSYEYWNTFMPEVPECQEAQDMTNAYGLLLDRSFTMVGLLRLAQLETDAGNDDVAQTLVDSATARAEEISTLAQEVFGTEE